MSDIFISYKREDQDKAKQLADVLEKKGWSVWWDPNLRAGERFDDAIQRALSNSKCVIALLSRSSTESKYVMNEARYALRRNKLIPVAIEVTELPFDFEGLHTPQLVDWDGSEQSPAFVNLVDDIAEKLGQPATDKPASAEGPADEEQPDGVADKEKMPPLKRTPRPGSSRWITGTAIVAIAAVVGVFLFSTEVKQVHRVSDEIFRDTLKDSFKGPEMMYIAGGVFEMGTDPEWDSSIGNEQPPHEVTIGAFYIGRYEVTFEEYDAFVRSTGRRKPDDRDWGRGRQPVINVSWSDAVAYTEWLSEQMGKRYRLPTEAEWEYAARVWTYSEYWWGSDIQQDGKVWANCDGCGSQWDKKQTAPVGSFKPNDFGVYDTAGNVWEWVQDCWHNSYRGSPDDGSAWEAAGGGDCAKRVIRGGSWNVPPRHIRSALRGMSLPHPDFSNFELGFRLARDF